MAITNASVVRVNVTSTASAVLKMDNRQRRGLHIFNDSGQILYVKLGENASSTDFTDKVTPGGRLSLRGMPIYVGLVTGRLAAGSGDVQVTESYS